MSRFFAVVSLSRSGSTAIHRALNAHREIRCRFEPGFSAAQWDHAAIAGLVATLRSKYSGIKHVWDPSGFPFVETHTSDLAALPTDRSRVLNANAVLLTSPDLRVVFIVRRNRLRRILSDLMSQQTGLWGPATPDGRFNPAANESVAYRQGLKQHQLRPLSLELVAWYLDHASAMEQQLRCLVSDAAALDVAFEDVFGADVTMERRLHQYRRMLDFLGYDSAPPSWNEATVRAVLSPTARLNDSATLANIPNIAEITARFGPLAE